ncbi:MAG: RNA polymerase sigma factor SigZ [Thermomicrobiales bacterium]
MTEEEFGGILEAHYERLRRFVRSRVSNPEEADDIVQEVCLRAVSKLDTIRDATRAESWLYQIARNAIIDHYRRRQPLAPLVDDLPGEADVAFRDTPDLSGCLPRLMDDLAEPDQQALRLTAIDGLKQRELAERLGISISGAKSRVQRARKRFRELIDTCCHLELDSLGGIINIQPVRDGGDPCDCPQGCASC